MFDGYSETWNGTDWSVVMMPSPADASGEWITGVSCASSDSCTAVGFYAESSAGLYGLTLAEAWNGSTWSVQSTPVPTGSVESFLSGVSCSPSGTCMAVGYYEPSGGGDSGLAEEWNGIAWSVESLPSPVGATGALPFDVSCGSSTTCTLTGYYVNTAGKGKALAEGWDGSVWSVQSTTNSGLLSGVSCNSPMFCVASGAYTKSRRGGDLTLAEGWDGTAWSIQAPAVLSIVVNPASGTPKTHVTISGAGFTDGASVVVTYQTNVRKLGDITLCNAVADTTGAYTCNAKIPEESKAGANGLHYIEAQEFGLGWVTTAFILK